VVRALLGIALASYAGNLPAMLYDKKYALFIRVRGVLPRASAEPVGIAIPSLSNWAGRR